MSIDGLSHTIAYCPACQAARTFNPDRCVVCGHPSPASNVVAFRQRDLDTQNRARSAGRRTR